jgi:hypothetical protein
MKNVIVRTSMIAGFVAMTAAAASAQTTVALPNQTQTTTMNANVSEQARVTVPASVTFNVTNTSAATGATASITVENIALASATKQLQISVAANATGFTPSVPGSATWASSDVSWVAHPFSNAGVGTAGALAGIGTYNVVQTCAVDVSECSTTTLPFSLAAKPGVKNSGNHSLIVTWKFASIGS